MKLVKFLIILITGILIWFTPKASYASSLPSIISDSQTQYFDGASWQNSIPTWVHPGWPQIGGATWIWQSATVNPAKVEFGEGPISFRKQFNISKPSKGVLKITADNAYKVLLDGNFIGSEGNLDPNGPIEYSWRTIETYNLNNISEGDHILTFLVVNYYAGFPGPTPFTNPAGLVYRLDPLLSSIFRGITKAKGKALSK